jgi:hypothetical protein
MAEPARKPTFLTPVPAEPEEVARAPELGRSHSRVGKEPQGGWLLQGHTTRLVPVKLICGPVSGHHGLLGEAWDPHWRWQPVTFTWTCPKRLD